VVVFRAAVLSIVVMLAAGPSASLICSAWCDTAAAATSFHHDESGSSARIASDVFCQDVVQNGIALKEDLRRAIHSMNPAALAPSAPAGVRLPDTRGRAPSGLKRPLITPLRI
jgi:hypothetical protein